ncbi:hypothetical protein [Cellulomonas sp. P5_C6]
MEVFRDFSGNNRGSFDHWEHPQSLSGLREAILSAETGNPPMRAHAVGSAWAFSAPAYCNGVEIDTRGLSSFSDVDWLQHTIVGPPQSGGALLAVPAGITVHDLDLTLRPVPGHPRRDHGDGIPAVGWPAGPFVLPTHGGAGGQSLAGALSTGTHGGDAARGAIGDFVRAMVLVGSHGVVRLIERSAPHTVCDAALVRAQVLVKCGPDTPFEAIADDIVFNAALVAMGRLGVIYAYVYEVADERTQMVFEQRTESTWEQTSPTVQTLLHDAIARDDFLQIVVVPVRGLHGTRSCFITKHTVAPPPHSPNPHDALAAAIATAGQLFNPPSPGGSTPFDVARGAGLGDFGQLMCSHDVTPELRDLQTALIVVALLLPLEPVLSALVAAVPGVPPLPPIDPLLGLILSVVLLAAAAEIGTIGPDHIVGDIVAELLNTAEQLGLAFIVGMVIDAALGSGQAPHLSHPNEDVPWLIHGSRAEIADFFDYDHDCYRGDSVELFFDANTIVNEMTPILALFDQAVALGRPPGGYISLRFLGRTRATLGMNQFAQTCAVEVSMLRDVNGNAELISNLQQLTLPSSGLVHWGQENDLNAGQVEAAFGGVTMAHWWDVVTRLEGDSMTFSNDFSRNHGLDVPVADQYAGWADLGMVSSGSPSIISAGGGRSLTVVANASGTVQTADLPDANSQTPWRVVQPTAVSPTARPVGIRSADHRTEVFVRGADERLWHTYEHDPGSDFAGWDTLGGAGTGRTIIGDPAVVGHLDGRLEVFAQESAVNTRRLLHAYAEVFVNGLWTSLDPAGESPIQSPPSATLRSHVELGGSITDQLVVVTAIEGGQPMVTAQIGPGGGSGWVPLSRLGDGTQVSHGGGTPIVIGSGGPRGAAHAYVLGVDGQLHEVAETDQVQAVAWGGWMPMQVASPDLQLAPDARLATPVTTNTQWLVGLSLRGYVVTASFDEPAGLWGPWVNRGGPFTGDVAAGDLDGGHLAIVARRRSDNQLLKLIV